MTLKINPSGTVQRLIWNERSRGWEVFFTTPASFCQVYDHCGANSVCNFDKTPNCECSKGFKPKSQHNQTRPGTCVRSQSSDCKSGDMFIMVDDIKLPDLLDVSLNESMNLKECEAECLKNRTCRAYANSKVTGGGSGCLMWFGDLIDITKAKFHNGQPIYIRVPASELVLLIAFCIFFRWRRKLKEKDTKTSQDLLLFDINMSTTTRSNEFGKGDKSTRSKSRDSSLPLFSLASVSAATNNFAVVNKLGEGGFGPVYKGRLLNGQEVAIKRLSGQSGQGLEEFKNEIKLIAKFQHRNLARLLGFCVEQDDKILIYEYTPNKSLDSFLFDHTKEGLLGWEARIRIIEGIVQGLLYLHQHFRSHQRSGYMSPEYALHGFFSIKSDVFSFGVLLLETLSSKRNTRFFHTDSVTLLGHAWNLWKNDKAWELIDPILQCEASYPIMKRYITVALLCVQEKTTHRPTMSEVVSMLTNEIINLPSLPINLLFQA